eukprot:jgi/Botrbrau1/6658/Bobra.0202s0006.1
MLSGLWSDGHRALGQQHLFEILNGGAHVFALRPCVYKTTDEV